jgi:hypothetical protein
MKQTEDKHLFKRKLKQLLINGCYCSIEDLMSDHFTGTDRSCRKTVIPERLGMMIDEIRFDIRIIGQS